MGKVVVEKVIVGLPDLKTEEGKICGDCQVGKQTNMSQKKVQHIITTYVFDLLHKDLMSPMKLRVLEKRGMSLSVLMITLDIPELISFVRSLILLLFLRD